MAKFYERFQTIEVGIEVDNSIMKALKKIPSDMSEGAGRALKRAAEEILKKSLPIVPVDTGALVSTGRTLGPTGVRSGKVRAEIVYGGKPGKNKFAPTVATSGRKQPDTVGYAVYVHEDSSKHHPHGQYEFLKQPLEQNAQVVVDEIQQEWGVIAGDHDAGHIAQSVTAAFRSF